MSQPSFPSAPETDVLPCPPSSDRLPAVAAPSAGKGPSREQRREVRWRCHLEARCQSRAPQAGEDWWPGRVRNLSAGGLMVVGTGPGHGGTLAIELRTGARGLVCLLLARVVHARPVAEGGWAFGCELLTRLSERQLRSLLL